MRPLTYSWIGLSAAAPLIFLVSAWALGVFHSYRRYWRSVDLFLLAVFVQELLTALQVFAFSLLSLTQPSSEMLCGAFVWSLSATRTLQAATVASLLVDRALTTQWPYKYRFSVRRHQIRYHLVVLATMAALVGVASLLARPSGDSGTSLGFEDCRFLPHGLHVRLALFLLSLYGILLVVSAVSACVAQTTRGCKGGMTHHPVDPQDMAPITHGTTGSSTTTTSSGGRTGGGKPLHPVASSASTTSSASSGRLGGGLHSASSTTDLVGAPPPLRASPKRSGRPQKKPGLRKAPSDFRWGASLVVAGLCFCVNHLPYMGLLVVGTFFPSYLPEWPLENLSLWLSLFEGLLLPLGLGLCDSTFGEAAILSYSKDHRKPVQKYDEPTGPLRLLQREEGKSFPLTNGSLFSSLLSMHVDPSLHPLSSYNRPKVHSGVMRMGTSSHEIRSMPWIDPTSPDSRLRGTFNQLFYNHEGPSSLGCLRAENQGSIHHEPLHKSTSSDHSLKLIEEDHIYATLSETFGSLSSMSDDYLGDNQRCSSATTVANDDFEYHGPRRCQPGPLPPHERIPSMVETQQNYVSACNFAMASREPAPLPPGVRYPLPSSTDESSDDCTPSSSFRSCSSGDVCESMVPSIPDRGIPYESAVPINLRSSPRLGFINEAFESDTFETPFSKRKNTHPIVDLNTSLPECEIEALCPPADGTLTRKHRSSSLSMNDLDRLENRDSDKEEEMMFILPVKSESMLSLYRLYLAEDEDSGCASLHYSLEVSKSESDLTSLHKRNQFPSHNSHSSQVHPPHVQEIYQKKRVPMSAGSRIRRQHKIQRAKGLHNRTRPILHTHVESPERQHLEEEKFWHEQDSFENKNQSQTVRVAVVNRAKRKNGIITIKDPSVLSVEELFKVLNRASVPEENERTVCKAISSEHSVPSSSCYPTTEYKKIFVSEYI